MIPNIFHFCYGFVEDFGERPFSLVHHLAIESALQTNDPQEARLYFRFEPEGHWWERTRGRLDLIRIEPPTEVAGRPILHHAHQTDLFRLQVLQKYGGIYLDVDVLCLRSFEPLRDRSFVMGQEGAKGSVGLCNAVLLAEKGAPFIDLWLEGFDPATSLWGGFRSKGRDRYWNEMAVRYPALLAERFPQHITVLDDRAFFWPTWQEEHLKLLFGPSDLMLEDAFCVHLWEQLSWQSYLASLTPERVREENTTFNRLARRFLQ